jgi:hypothetical protein
MLPWKFPPEAPDFAPVPLTLAELVVLTAPQVPAGSKQAWIEVVAAGGGVTVTLPEVLNPPQPLALQAATWKR